MVLNCNSAAVAIGECLSNMYGCGQSSKVPIGEYRWLEMQDITTVGGGETCDVGHIIEVDLHYPKELHLAHSSLPLAPHKMGEKIDCTYVCSGEIEKSQSDKSEIENVERDS